MTREPDRAARRTPDQGHSACYRTPRFIPECLDVSRAFAPRARLRNWLMFEVALELGIRRGELLKLRLDSLPRGANDGVLILRRPDDPNDSRPHEPAVKTAERAIPASRSLLSAIRAYLTYPPPLGRVSGKSPYLFVARSGAPLFDRPMTLSSQSAASRRDSTFLASSSPHVG